MKTADGLRYGLRTTTRKVLEFEECRIDYKFVEPHARAEVKDQHGAQRLHQFIYGGCAISKNSRRRIQFGQQTRWTASGVG